MDIHLIVGPDSYVSATVANAVYEYLPPSKMLIFDGYLECPFDDVKKVKHLVIKTTGYKHIALRTAASIINRIPEGRVFLYVPAGPYTGELDEMMNSISAKFEQARKYRVMCHAVAITNMTKEITNPKVPFHYRPAPHKPKLNNVV